MLSKKWNRVAGSLDPGGGHMTIVYPQGSRRLFFSNFLSPQSLTWFSPYFLFRRLCYYNRFFEWHNTNLMIMNLNCFAEKSVIKHNFFLLNMGKNNHVVIVHFYLSPGSAKQWRQSHSYCTFFQTNFHLLWFFIDTSYIYVFFSEFCYTLS